MTRDPQRAKVYAAEEFVRTLFDRTAEHGDPGVDFFGTGPRSAAISAPAPSGSTNSGNQRAGPRPPQLLVEGRRNWFKPLVATRDESSAQTTDLRVPVTADRAIFLSRF